MDQIPISIAICSIWSTSASSSLWIWNMKIKKDGLDVYRKWNMKIKRPYIFLLPSLFIPSYKLFSKQSFFFKFTLFIHLKYFLEKHVPSVKECITDKLKFCNLHKKLGFFSLISWISKLVVDAKEEQINGWFW